MVYLCTAWQNKQPRKISDLQKNYYNYLTHLEKLKTEVNSDFFTKNLGNLIQKGYENISNNPDTQYIQNNIEQLESEHNKNNDEETEEELKRLILDHNISYEDRLKYEAIQKERKQLSNPNTEIQHVFKQNDIVSIDIEKMYEDHKVY